MPSMWTWRIITDEHRHESRPERRPTHPGEILRDDVLPALDMSRTEFAKLLDVGRVTVSELLLGKRALTADMAVRIATRLKTTPETWLRMQEALDLWQVTQEPPPQVRCR
jgi:addiction module HigA family antidote